MTEQRPRRLRALGEVVAIVSVVASLGLVAYELRQNTLAARAAAYQEIGLNLTTAWQELAMDPAYTEVLLRSGDSTFFATMTPEQHRMLWAGTLSALRRLETVFLQTELGLLDASALESFGFESSLRNLVPLNVYWETLRESVEPTFADYMEERFDLPGTPQWGPVDPWGDNAR